MFRTVLSRFILVFAMIFMTTTGLFAQTNVPPIDGGTGCIVNGNIYWDRVGSTNTFMFIGGTYSPWTSGFGDYSVMPQYACSNFNQSSTGCTVNGNPFGRIGVFTFTACPLDSHIALFCIAVLLCLTFLYRRENFAVTASIGKKIRIFAVH